MKEIINKEELRDLIKETVNEVADTVCYTYGPNGKTVILSDFEGKGIVTKDGVSVCNSINFENPYKNIIANIIKQVAQKTVEEADDGTTTSICLTQAFINKGYELLEQGISYNEIKIALEELQDYTIKELKKNSRKVRKKDIISIAKTASNNDMVIAKMIRDAYKHSKIVKAEESTLSEDKLITITGMPLRATYFSSAFINDNKTQSIKYNDCYIALIDGEMYSVDPIVNIVNKLEDKALIIFADNFTDNIVNIFKQKYNDGSFDIALVKTPGVNNHRRNILDDISVYTGASILEPNKKYNELPFFGLISGIEIKKEETILYNEYTSISLDVRKEELKELLKTDLSKYDKELAQQRLESLSGSASIIKVGGESPVEIKERFDRYEDAIGSVKHALDEGYVEGGGLALLNAWRKSEFENDTTRILMRCVNECFLKINGNITDEHIFNLGGLVDTFNKSILDPLKVTRCALENAISVAKTILSTEAIVLNKYLWKE